MDGSASARVTGVQGIQHRYQLRTSNLSNGNSIWAHSKRFDQQPIQPDLALPLHIGHYTWNFYQAKSIKQSIAEGQLEDAKDPKRREQLQAKIERYESDPKTGEGKKELMLKARELEADRDNAKKNGPWLTFAGSALQLSIVLLSAAILAVSMGMFWASLGVSAIGALLMSQGIWLWLPI